MCHARFLDIFRLSVHAYESLTVFCYLLERKDLLVLQFIQKFTSNSSVFLQNESLNKYQTLEIIRTQCWQFEIFSMLVHDRRESSVIFLILTD